MEKYGILCINIFDTFKGFKTADVDCFLKVTLLTWLMGLPPQGQRVADVDIFNTYLFCSQEMPGLAQLVILVFHYVLRGLGCFGCHCFFSPVEIQLLQTS